MDEAIKLLREQAILCGRLNELLDALTEDLKNVSHGTEEIVQQIDPLVLKLSKNSADTQKFLKASNFKNFGEYLATAEIGTQKDVAEKLLKQVVSRQEKLVGKMKIAAGVLVNGFNFINFNLNLLSQTSASTTYGSEAKTATKSERRIFDANV